MTKTSTSYFPEVDGIRALAAVFVVLHHSFLQVVPDLSSKPSGLMFLLGSVLLQGRFAVDTFIVVSGFCLMMPVLRHDGLKGGAIDFYRRRFRRIILPYWAAICLSLIMIYGLIGRETGTHWDQSSQVSWQAIVVCMLGMTDQFYKGAVNHVFWSICVELKIYLLFPAMISARRVVGMPTVSLAVLLACAGLHFVLGRSGYRVAALGFFPLFMLGTLAASVVSSTDARWTTCRERISWRLVWMSLALGLGLMCYRHGYGLIASAPFSMIAGLLAAAFLVDVTTQTSWYARALADWRLVAIGTVSFSLYLLHAPILQVVHQYFLMPLNLNDVGQFMGLSLVALPASLVLAWVFGSIFEAGWFINRQGAVARSRDIAVHSQASTAGP